MAPVPITPTLIKVSLPGSENTVAGKLLNPLNKILWLLQLFPANQFWITRDAQGERVLLMSPFLRQAKSPYIQVLCKRVACEWV